MIIMETETPQPSRYRTIRRKRVNNAPISTPAPTVVAAPAPIHFSPPPKGRRPAIHSPTATQEQSSARQSSKFRQILRLNTHAKEPTPTPPILRSATAAVPQQHSKLTKGHSHLPPKRANTTRDEVIDKTLEKLTGGGASPKKYSPYNEPDYDFKVPCLLDTGAVEQMGTCNTTDAEAFLKRARPRKERILLESWPTLGLQRQVRHFELISDVANTWDLGDTHCRLKVEKWAWGQTTLNVREFPKEEPASGVAQFHYFNKAEKKWSRRWIKLGNGAVRIAKKDKPNDKDFTQVISLDSFDAYTFANPLLPNEKLKCPTKYCFALKSQHQQSLFGKDAVYCHYFAAENEAQMAEWFSLIRDFKSRLIAEKRSLAWWAAVSDSDDTSTSAESVSPTVSPTASPRRGRRRQGPLVSPEELSHPPPAMDMQRGEGIRHAKSIARPKTRKHRSPSVNPKSPEGHSGEGMVFSPGGLLGQDYEDKRRLAQLAFKEERSQPHNEYTLNSQAQAPGYRKLSLRGPHQPLISIETSQKEPKTLQRAGTVASRPSSGHRQGTTLLNFSGDETIPSLPHHQRGRGRTVSCQHTKAKGGLISLVKSGVGEVSSIPPSQIISHNKKPLTGKGRSCRGESDDEQTAFTGMGLLSHSYHSAGATTMGHGVASGRDAVGRNGETMPLLCASSKSVFVPGSLLEKRERELGPTRPVIDRDPHSSDDE